MRLIKSFENWLGPFFGVALHLLLPAEGTRPGGPRLPLSSSKQRAHGIRPLMDFWAELHTDSRCDSVIAQLPGTRNNDWQSLSEYWILDRVLSLCKIGALQSCNIPNLQHSVITHRLWFFTNQVDRKSDRTPPWSSKNTLTFTSYSSSINQTVDESEGTRACERFTIVTT